MRPIVRPDEFQPTQKIKFSKSETEYNMKSIRFLLLMITTMFILIGILMIVIGFSVYSHYHSFSYFYKSAISGQFFTPSIMCVIIGMMMVIVSSLGFFGSLKKSTCMINVYALILTIIFIIKLAVVIVAFTIDMDTLRNYLYIPVWEYGADPEFQAEIDSLQSSLSCCGSNSVWDWRYYIYSENHSTFPVVYQNVSLVLPMSCCTAYRPMETSCSTNSFWATGCMDALSNAIVMNSSILGVLGVSVMFIQLLGIVFSILMASSIRKFKSERALMLWKIKEQMIMNRESQAQDTQKNDTVYIVRQESSVA